MSDGKATAQLTKDRETLIRISYHSSICNRKSIVTIGDP